MAWVISSNNNGYPLYEEAGPPQFTTFTKPIPNNAWWINKSYPFRRDLEPRFTRFYSTLPVLAWRITAGYNDGYPYNRLIADDEIPPEPDPTDPASQFNNTGQTGNYGTLTPYGKSEMDVDNTPMDGSFKDTSNISSYVASCTNSYAISFAQLGQITSAITTGEGNWLSDAANRLIVSQLFGANIYNCFVLCKMFPFTIPSTTTKAVSTCCGMIELLDSAAVPSSLTIKLDFGTIDLNITWAYEIEGGEYSIYLPYSGYYSLPIKGNEILHLMGLVDMTTGQIDYYITSNGQIIFEATGKCGIDIPINLSQGQMLQNAIGNTVAIGGRALGLATHAAGVGNPITDAIGNTMQNIGESSTTQVDMSCKLSGGLSATLSP